MIEINSLSLVIDVLKEVWYLIPVVVFVSILRTPWFKGVFGEFQVNFFLKSCLPKKSYHLIKNVTLPTSTGTTQIDHVLVSRKGVFVIETKNMKGWIFGSAKQKQWTQRIFKFSSKFQNPLHQNYKHIKTLESSLSIPLESIYSVIVFVGNSRFKTAMPDNVMHARGLIKFIKSKQTDLLTKKQLHYIIKTIKAGQLQLSFKTSRDHVAHVKDIVSNKQSRKSRYKQ